MDPTVVAVGGSCDKACAVCAESVINSPRDS